MSLFKNISLLYSHFRVILRLIPKKAMMTKKELETRLINFTVLVSDYVVQNNKNRAILHLNDQAIRSSTSSALNYGEAQSAESKKDFIHKISIVMKELRETYINLNIIKGLNPNADKQQFTKLLVECDQLLAIFFKTIQSTRKSMGT